MNIRHFAITYPQLMNQALKQGVKKRDLLLLRTCYDTAEKLADGFYRSQGVPFITHFVRHASILLAEKQPIHVVCACLVHSAYLFGRFQDERHGKATAAHRRELRQRLNKEIEQLVFLYDQTPWGSPEAIENHLKSMDNYGKLQRQVLIMRIANELEDHLDHGIAYSKKARSKEYVEKCGKPMITIARRLGYNTLANELTQAFASYLAFQLPKGLIRKHPQRYQYPSRMTSTQRLRTFFSKTFVGRVIKTFKDKLL